MDKVRGSMEALNAMQLTADMEGLDAQSKMLLRSKEVLAFRAKNPQLSTEDILVSLHVDVEPQKSYMPGYSIWKNLCVIPALLN